VQAEILHNAGYDVYNWQDKALLRAVQFLYNIGWPATSDDVDHLDRQRPLWHQFQAFKDASQAKIWPGPPGPTSPVSI
jgi:hypothetical protein